MRYLFLTGLILILGCASPKITIRETENGIVFESDEGNYSAEYEHEGKKAKVDTKNVPIVNITTPDIEVGK